MYRNLTKLKEKLQDFHGILRDGRMEKDVKVLMFHRIGEPRKFIPEDHCISEEDFEKTISNFANEHQFVSLDDLSMWLENGEDIPDKSIVVTFDDGFLSIKEKALPILERFNVPATVFVPSEFLEIRYPAGFKFTAFLDKNDRFGFDWKGEHHNFVLESKRDRREAYDELTSLCGGLKVVETEQLSDSVGVEKANKGELMNINELKELDETELISIGAHSTDHRRLTGLESEEARKSIVESKERLEDVLGHEVNSFSFPFGAKNKELVKMVEEAGYNNAVVTEGREISERDWGKSYRIPRIDGKDL